MPAQTAGSLHREKTAEQFAVTLLFFNEKPQGLDVICVLRLGPLQQSLALGVFAQLKLLDGFNDYRPFGAA